MLATLLLLRTQLESLVTMGIGSVVLLGGIYLALRPAEVAASIRAYYQSLARRKRNWPRWLAWQPSPGDAGSRVMAWILIGAALAIGGSAVASSILSLL